MTGHEWVAFIGGFLAGGLSVGTYLITVADQKGWLKR